MATVSAIVVTGAFTLAAALGGAALSTASSLVLARRNEHRQDVQDFRRERIRVYGGFLTAIAALETAANYLASVLRRHARSENERAWSLASSSNDRALHALSELELLAGDDVYAKAKDLSALAREHFRLCGEGEEGINLNEARTATATAMQAELGVSQVR